MTEYEFLMQGVIHGIWLGITSLGVGWLIGGVVINVTDYIKENIYYG